MTEGFTFLLALAAAVLSALSLVLHVIAPRTKSTIDDRLRDDLDEVLVFIRGTPAAPPPKPTSSSLTTIALLLVLIGAALTSCAVVKAAPGAARVAVIDCTKADSAPIVALIVQLGVNALNAALHTGAVDWDALEAAAWAQGRVVGGCALAEFVHGVTATPAAQEVPRALLAPPDPAVVALERLRAKAGGVRFATAAGVL